MIKKIQSIYFLIFISLSVSAQVKKPPYSAVKQIIVEKAAISSAHPLATQIGVNILKKGGNAFDAAISVQFALAVVLPAAGNLGGGGFMVARNKEGKTFALDFRETAPAKAHRDMYLDKNKDIIPKLSTHGHLAVGVPGTVAGIFEILPYCKLSLAQLIQPAIDLAENGFPITALEARMLNSNSEHFKTQNTQPSVFSKNTSWHEGDILVQKDLAKTLERIKIRGKKGFYEGETAKLIVAEMKRGGGIIDLKDLKNYKVKRRTPIEFSYKNYTLISMPLPSSGGILLKQLFGMIEPYPISRWGFQTPPTAHLMIEAERRAYADRATHLGDNDFFKTPLIESITNKKYLSQRMQDFNVLKSTPSAEIKAGSPLQSEHEETTHFSIIDAEGNAVALTTTLNGAYGSFVTVGGAGFLLNNEMDDFSSKPNVPNSYGLVGSEANAIAPHKRMLSSMTPTILLKDGKLFMVVGTPGGSTIITSVFQAIVNIIEFNMSLQKAIDAPKFHQQWLPENTYIENDFDENTQKELEKMGHSFQKRGYIGHTDAILVLPDGRLEAVGDKRGDDSAGGF